MPPRTRSHRAAELQAHQRTQSRQKSKRRLFPPCITVDNLPPELLLRIMSLLGAQPSPQALCRAACTSTSWRDLARANEEYLWRPMVALRWRSQPALESLGVGARRQYVLLAKSVQKPRATPASLQAAYQFSVEIIVGDMPPMVSAAELRGGWFEYGPGMPGWEMPIQVDAHFPELKLQAPPPRVNINSRISWDEGHELTQPQPIDEPLELRVIVKRRSDEKVAVLLSLATQLRDWMPHPRYGFGDDDQAETACVGMGCIGKEPLRVWPPPSWVEPTGRELVGGSYGLEVEMYWAGPADRWGNRDENLLRIDGLKRAFYQWGREPQTEELALADLAAILLAPDCAHGALRWV